MAKYKPERAMQTPQGGQVPGVPHYYGGPYLPIPVRQNPTGAGLPFTTAGRHDAHQRYDSPRPSLQMQRVIGPCTAARMRGSASTIQSVPIDIVDPTCPGSLYGMTQGHGWRERRS